MDEEKRYEGTPEKKKKERNVMVCPAVPSEKKKRDGSNWIFKLQKKKKELREKDGTCAGLTEE